MVHLQGRGLARSQTRDTEYTDMVDLLGSQVRMGQSVFHSYNTDQSRINHRKSDLLMRLRGSKVKVRLRKSRASGEALGKREAKERFFLNGIDLT